MLVFHMKAKTELVTILARVRYWRRWVPSALPIINQNKGVGKMRDTQEALLRALKEFVARIEAGQIEMTSVTGVFGTRPARDFDSETDYIIRNESSGNNEITFRYQDLKIAL